MNPSPDRDTAPMGQVFAFVFQHWSHQRGRALLIAGAMSLATVTEIFVPVEAGRLVDALAAGTAGRPAALAAFATMAALGGAMVALRHVAWWNIMPFTLKIMRDVAQDAFHRV